MKIQQTNFNLILAKYIFKVILLPVAIFVLLLLHFLYQVNEAHAATPAFVKEIGSKEQGATSSTTVVTVSSGGVAQNNLIYGAALHESQATIVSVFDSRGNDYVIGSTVEVTSGTAWRSTVFYGVAGTALSAGDLVTVTWSTSFYSHTKVSLLEYSGIEPFSYVLDSNTAMDGVYPRSTSLSSGSITTSSPNALLVTVCTTDIGNGGIATYTPTSGFTKRAQSLTSSNTTLQVEDRVVTSAGTYSSSPALSADKYWTCHITAFKASTGAIAPAPIVAPISIYNVKKNGSGHFTTIQACLNQVKAGDTCLVEPGNFTENVVFNRPGASNALVYLKAEYPYSSSNNSNRTALYGSVTMRNYTSVSGLELVNQGVLIDGSNVEVIGNYIHGSGDESVGVGVSMVRPSGSAPYYSNVKIKDNHIYQIRYGIFIYCSDNCLVENNDIQRLYTSSICRVAGVCAGDSDYARLHGNGIKFKGNKFYGSTLKEIDEDAHVDGIQTFNNGGLGGQGKDTLTNTIIENNYIADFHQAMWLTAVTSGLLTHDITIRNNIFNNTWSSYARISIGGTYADNIYVYNNLFNQSVRITAQNKAVIKNNMFTGNLMITEDDKFVWPQKNFEISSNLFFKGGWMIPSIKAITDIGNKNIFDVLTSDVFTDFATSDFRFKSGNPAIDVGVSLASTGFDYDANNVSRPQGSMWDVGPYEYCATSCSASVSPAPIPVAPKPTPAPTPTPTPAPVVNPNADSGNTATTLIVKSNHYPDGTIFKYANNQTVYIKEGGKARPITDFTVYQNQVPLIRNIITIPSTVTFPQGDVVGLRSGTLVKSFDNPTVYLVINGKKFTFTSEQQFKNHSYDFSKVQTINDPNLVKSLPAHSGEFTRPRGTLFKYPNSSTVYFLNSEQKKMGFTTLSMYNLWVSSPKDVITIPESETYLDGPIVTLPNGILVKGSGTTTYFTVSGMLRPFTSTSLFNAMGLNFSQVHTLPDSDIRLHAIGNHME